VNIFSEDAFANDGESGEELSRPMVWLRTTLSQVCRMPQRGQSRQSTGSQASDVLILSREGEVSVSEGESGFSTALTRRGFSVVLLS
jgi:hypothetical protein